MRLLQSMVGLGRVELPTRSLGNCCSIHLSYSPAHLFIQDSVRFAQNGGACFGCELGKRNSRRGHNPGDPQHLCVFLFCEGADGQARVLEELHLPQGFTGSQLG
jgi:hypothetical protein